MDRGGWRNDQPGITLPVVLVVLLAVGALSVAAALTNANTVMIHMYDERQSVLEAAADAGLEEARARLNGNRALYPDSGFITLEDRAVVRDAENREIPNIRRSIYVGPTGVTSGQYGVYGSIVSEVVDAGGARVVRRLEITQESFARFAYFTDREPAAISFGAGDQIFGPVHTNDVLKIYDSGATFHGPVTTARYISGRDNGDFRKGYEERVPRIPMPETAELNKLSNLAMAGNLLFTSSTGGSQSQAALRIEFDTAGGYGFIRVYRAANSNQWRWVTADVPSDYNSQGLRNSRNCGHFETDGTFVSADDHPSQAGKGQHNWRSSLENGGRCFLGGAPELFGGFQNALANDTRGNWLEWPGTTPQFLIESGRPDSAHLFPINREMNTSFKGVIFVQGKVAVSGVVRGHVTLAASDDIIIVDDLTYATDPGSENRNCQDGVETNDDILGLFAGGDIVVADNTINSPKLPDGGNGNNYVSFDDTPDEFIHATILALGIFTVDEYDRGSWSRESCEGRTWGRGCLYLTGGVIQGERGPVGAIYNSGGYGYVKRYSYDECVRTSPPPFFPTTGHFTRGRVYEVNPNTFEPGAFFAFYSAGL